MMKMKFIYLFKTILLCIFVLLSILGDSKASKIESMIYKTVTNYSACVSLTNSTHQIGCTSEMNGNQGVVHLINSDADIDWMIEDGPHHPYIPLLDTTMFNEDVMKRLMDSKKINGLLVMHKKSTKNPSGGFSPDDICPMDKFGLYTGDETYGSCKKVKWNHIGNGMSFVFYGIPIFLLQSDEEIAFLLECFQKHNQPINGTARSYPLCAVEMKDFMFAAKDTPTCRRKTEMPNPIQSTYCDPLGDWNVYGTLYPMVGELLPDQVIMITAKIDSTGFFHDFIPAVDNGVTSLVTLLSVAYALGKYKRDHVNATSVLKHPIAFSLFNGEVWDYIGSSRMVWDMENKRFPHQVNSNERPPTSPYDDLDKNTTSKVNLDNLGYFIEISQVGKTGHVYAHTDPISQEDPKTKAKVDKLLDTFIDSAKRSSLSFKVVDRSENNSNPLPPASFQRFLKSKKYIPGLVLTDHEAVFTNWYYNSRFDNAQNLDISLGNIHNISFVKLRSPVTAKLTNLSETIANAVFLLASDGVQPKERITIPVNLTANLLYCFIYSANCPVFKEIFGRKNRQLPNMPYSRYVSVLQLDNVITQILHRLLSYYTGDWLDEKECTDYRKKLALPKVNNYAVVKGPYDAYLCYRSHIYKTRAVSPAFELDDLLSTKYSTWAESMWNSDIGIQVYLKADPSIEGAILACGLLMFFVSFACVYFINKKATILFTPNILVTNG